MSDAINPIRYKHLPAEAIDIIMAAIAKAPSNKSAYLHGQVLKYLLRCWEKKGIEDLRKAKWYLDRLVASFDDPLAEINAPILEGASNNPTASLNSDKIPKGYRKLGDSSIEPRQLDDLRWSVSENRYVGMSSAMLEFANQENWAACRKIEDSPKRYREPTPADLANGPIECEVGDNHEKRTLIYVFRAEPKDSRFVVVDETKTLCTERWSICRIEVQK